VHLARVALAALPLGLASWSPAAAAEDPPPTAALPAPPPQEGEPAGPATPLAVLEGRILAVDLAGHTVALEVAGARVSLALDRNTLVYLPAGLSTVEALRPGDAVRAGRNDHGRAYWIEVRRAPAAAP